MRQRGGLSNVARTGRALDCAALFARKGVAVSSCDKYGFPKQKSYHYTKYGGERPANQLIRELARKGNYVCSLWVYHHCAADYTFSREGIDGYDADEAFLEFMEAGTPGTDAFTAGLFIKDWVPRGS